MMDGHHGRIYLNNFNKIWKCYLFSVYYTFKDIPMRSSTSNFNTDDIQYYLKDLRKIPVITHERQEEIFILLKDKTIDEIKRKKIMDELIGGNLRFVVSVAKTFQNQGMLLGDLINEGNLGLIKAVERFDETRGFKFISYAVWWIRQTILAALNEHSRTIRIPSNIIQETQKSKRDDVKGDYDVRDRIEGKSFYLLPRCVSLAKEINEDGDQLIDIIRDPNEENPENALNSTEEIKKRVDAILSVLDEREKIIIEKYFGLKGIESNLEDLGEEFDCTKERIRQLKDKAIKKLRNESYFLLNYLYDK